MKSMIELNMKKMRKAISKQMPKTLAGFSTIFFNLKIYEVIKKN